MVLRGIEAIAAIKAGQELLEGFRDMNPEAYDKIMSEPIKGCACGLIKEGDDTFCSNCEKSKEENK